MQAPERNTEAADQRKFDEAVEKKGKALLEWLAGAGILAALLMSTVALIKSGEHDTASVASSGPATSAGKSAAATPSLPAKGPIAVKIVGGYKPGPDGKKHDAFSKTEYAMRVGQPLKLRIDNTDDVPHSITSPAVNVNITVQPGVHTYMLKINRAGRFQWFCIIPCDTDAGGWAMQHAGFMAGYITVT